MKAFRITNLFLIFILITISAFSQTDKKVAQEDIFRRYLQTGNEGIAQLIANAKEPTVYTLFCKALFEDDEMLAIDLYTEFIQKQPKYGLVEAYFNRGIKYNAIEKMDLAISDFDKAIELEIEDPYLYYYRGASYAAMENYDKAIEDYSEAIKLDSEFSLAYLMRGNSYLDKQDYTNALKDFNNTIKIDANDEQAYLMRAYVYVELGEYDKALKDCNKVKQMNPDMSENADFIIELINKQMK